MNPSEMFGQCMTERSYIECTGSSIAALAHVRTAHPTLMKAQLDQAIERLKQATRDMQNAASSQSAGSPQSEAEARRAAERLSEARDLISGMRKRQGGEQLSELARKGETLYAAYLLEDGETVPVRVVNPVFVDPEGKRLHA